MHMVDSLAVTLEAKDAYTNGHSSRVADYSVIIGRRLGWGEDKLSMLYRAALLHDIGKIGVPDSILNKPGKLNDEEFAIIKSHAVIGSDILESLDSLEFAREISRHHHERFDGNGYPDKLKGYEIPIEARVVCVADAFDAMSSRRVYRAPLSKEYIREEFVNCSGKHFDPEICDVFIELFDTGAFDSLDKINDK